MADSSMDFLARLREELTHAHPDQLRGMLQALVEQMMGTEVDALCGAVYGERSPDRVNARNGYRARQWDTRAGSIDLQILRVRQGSYYPGWLLEPRRRAERALVSVVAEAYLAGVSTRRVEGLVQSLGIEGISSPRSPNWPRAWTRSWSSFAIDPSTPVPKRTCGWTPSTTAAATAAASSTSPR